MLQFSCYNFFIIEISCLHEKKKQNQINLVKTCYMTKPFHHSKIEDTKTFKRIKKSEINIPSINLQKQPPEVSMKKGVLRSFTKFLRKHLCQNLRPATLLNKRLWHRCFTVNFANTEYLWTTTCEFINETLIFRSSRSQMFFKVSVVKNFAILEPLSNNKPSFTEHLWWLLLNFCGSKHFFVAEHDSYC